MRLISASLSSLALFVSLFSHSAQAEVQLIAGSGSSVKLVELFAQHFGAQPVSQGVQFKVPPGSAKHAGGIKASSTYLFGRTGRPLNEKERAMNKGEIFLARIPIAFATGSHTAVTRLTMQQLQSIFDRTSADWSEIGGAEGPIILVGREPTESLFGVLKKEYPFFKQVQFDYVLKKDHQVVNFLKSKQGSRAIGFGAKPNFDGLNVVEIEGFSVGVSVGLVYDLSNADHPLVKGAQQYVNTPQWHQAVQQGGMLPPA